ncbi:MAG: hypothetical protein ABI114_01890 [Rhodanobacter sp.]
MAKRSVFKTLAFITLLFIVVWAAVILYWRSSNRIPNGADVALYLIVLPVLLLLGYLGLRYGIDKVKQRKQDAAVPDTAQGVVEAQPDTTLTYTLPLLASETCFAAGDTPQALAEAARAGKLVDLHTRLKDERGLPVFAAEVEAIDLDALDETATDAVQALSEAQKRALWLGESLAVKILDEHFASLVAAHAAPADTRGRSTATTALQIEWLLPARWTEDERQLAQSWLVTQLAAQQWNAPQVTVATRTVDKAIQALKRLDDINVQFNQGTLVAHVLLLASESFIDDETIQRWSQARQLHNADTPEGRMPGEGACALLVGKPRGDEDSAAPRLHRIVFAQRAQSADARGRVDTSTLQSLLEQSLLQAAADTSLNDAGHVVADTDTRPSRTAESLQWVDHNAPDQDPTALLLSLGASTGDCGAASALASVAVAAALTAATQQAGFALSLHDAYLRAVALIDTATDAATDSNPTAADAAIAATSTPTLV